MSEYPTGCVDFVCISSQEVKVPKTVGLRRGGRKTQVTLSTAVVFLCAHNSRAKTITVLQQMIYYTYS